MMTDHGPSLCAELIRVYSAGGGHKKNAPRRNGANKTHDDWPGQYDPRLTRSRYTRD